jgi:serine/threonine protein kinase
MSKGPHLRKKDKILISGEEYELIENLSRLRGFQFRTWKVKKGKKEYVAKITSRAQRALREVRAYIFLKTKGYPERYYAEMIAFDYEAKHIKSGRRFFAILLKYLPSQKFKPLDEYLKNPISEKMRKRLAQKLRRRVEKLHELGMCHGDIRKENILVRKTKRGIGLRLIDYGLSKFCDDKEKQKDLKRVDIIERKILQTKTSR